MANGQQLAEQNFQIFTAWLSSRSDDDFRQVVSRGSLSRKEIAAQCRFAVSALNQNPRIKAALLAKESSLRVAGVLPPIANKTNEAGIDITVMRESSSVGQSHDNERLRRLALENASLKAENSQLKRELERIAVLRDILSATGRLPR